MTRRRIRDLTADGISWRIDERGEAAAAPILFLHGFMGTAESWEEVVDRLERFRCLTIDLPGHGRTAAPLPPESWRMERLADALGGILDRLGGGTFDLVGYSMGGRAALYLAHRAPQKVRRLVLIGASPGIGDPEERRSRAEADLDLARLLEEQGIERFVRRWEEHPLFASQAGLPETARARQRAIRLSNDPHRLAAALRAFGPGFQTPLHDALPGLPMPVLLVAGEADEKYRILAEAMAARMRQARIETIEGAGHAVAVEAPQRLAAAIDAFLR